MLISAKWCDLEMVGKSNTTLKRGGLMNPLKGGRFDIHFHRRDAEHAEDLFNFLLSAERPESKNQQPLGASTCYYQ
jgi:hypothetical protein